MLKVATPKVTKIGATVGLTDKIRDLGMDCDPFASTPESLMEFAGRICYQSQHKPNEATRANEDYLANILDHGHESVLEHATFTFYIEGVSRALTHELIRHRHLSYSQLSQRFVDESNTAIVLPPAIEEYSDNHLYLNHAVSVALDQYKKMVHRLQEQGLGRKQAREAARAVLPNCVETKIVVSGNIRAWRDMLKKRLDPTADAEIRQVSSLIFAELESVVPNALQDLSQ